MVAAAGVANLALAHQVVHRQQRFIEAGVTVPVVQQVEVDVVELQALEASLDFAHDVKAGEAAVVGPLADPAPDFGGDDQIVALAGHILEGLAEHLLATTGEIEVGAVDKVDSQVDGALDDADAGGLVGHALPETAEGGAQTDGGYLDAEVAQFAVVH